jgi:hypothetical protein
MSNLAAAKRAIPVFRFTAVANRRIEYAARRLSNFTRLSGWSIPSIPQSNVRSAARSMLF